MKIAGVQTNTQARVYTQTHTHTHTRKYANAHLHMRTHTSIGEHTRSYEKMNTLAHTLLVSAMIL